MVKKWLAVQTQSIIISSTQSNWRTVISSMSYRSVLGLLLFSISSKDLNDGMVTHLEQFCTLHKAGRRGRLWFRKNGTGWVLGRELSMKFESPAHEEEQLHAQIHTGHRQLGRKLCIETYVVLMTTKQLSYSGKKALYGVSSYTFC